MKFSLFIYDNWVFNLSVAEFCCSLTSMLILLNFLCFLITEPFEQPITYLKNNWANHQNKVIASKSKKHPEKLSKLSIK